MTYHEPCDMAPFVRTNQFVGQLGLLMTPDNYAVIVEHIDKWQHECTDIIRLAMDANRGKWKNREWKTCMCQSHNMGMWLIRRFRSRVVQLQMGFSSPPPLEWEASSN